ncbi:BlaI/MecI/CopY family transcriptional regulator [Chitinophaga nivalis]|uniref:BlaI/MecI/CopY family transcriptional regulator n=1 Tax=Chitinophaga nivalis TaxID=2991709 RepID=A0ABT3IPR6_9BACT|nr:BlaI/MecI/CopY family transcriptional regulator [Chitinophaga nivalis]MCW3464342.1 BlaI/MecI/CopY family transcriptional regulator [Chitinophaga nivalis]MCW3485967.1 BlaI/MecI/CopY family transcriptional regulator [Chitinophaga nivalis]
MKHIRPTESELEILSILWERGASTVREVHDILSQTKDAGYTTTLKLMQIMHEKKLLDRDASSKTHVFTTAVSQQTTRQQLLNKMIDTVFGGSASQLVMQALGHHQSSDAELDKIRQYLSDIEKQQKDNG